MSQSNLILVDTNVWLDYFQAYRPMHGQAFSFLSKALEKGYELVHAAISVKDLYYLISAGVKREVRLQKKGILSEQDARAAREIAWACVSSMESISSSVGCDQSDVWIAEKQRAVHDDFEDDLIIAAAMRSDARLLVTNDEKFLQHCPVATLSVSDALKWL